MSTIITEWCTRFTLTSGWNQPLRSPSLVVGQFSYFKAADLSSMIVRRRRKDVEVQAEISKNRRKTALACGHYRWDVFSRYGVLEFGRYVHFHSRVPRVGGGISGDRSRLPAANCRLVPSMVWSPGCGSRPEPYGCLKYPGLKQTCLETRTRRTDPHSRDAGREPVVERGLSGATGLIWMQRRCVPWQRWRRNMPTRCSLWTTARACSSRQFTRS